MKPILFSIGPIHIYSFGFMMASGVMVSLFLMSRDARREGFPKRDQVFDWVFVTILSGFLGGRIFYVLQHIDFYWQQPLKILALQTPAELNSFFLKIDH